ncbi:hypothetical protein ABVT39_005775 [Epinephelus coioides]
MTSKMVIRQPQPVMEARESDEWGSGICDCCDNVPECCFAFWCCPCFACKTTKKYGQCLCLPLLDIFGCIPPITMAMRVSMRQRYGIKLVSDGQRDEEKKHQSGSSQCQEHMTPIA